MEAKRLQSGLEVLGYRKAPIHETLPHSPDVVEEAGENFDAGGGGNSRQFKSRGEEGVIAGYIGSVVIVTPTLLLSSFIVKDLKAYYKSLKVTTYYS